MTDLPTSYLIRDRHGAHRYEVRAVYGEQG